MSTLIVDTRERKVFSSLDKINIDYRVEQITQGDYRIEINDTILAVIERKTLKDYAASMNDGRHENKEKLLMLREATNCKIFYIIEGPLNTKLDTTYGRIKYEYILTSIRHLQINDNISIIRTSNCDHTARELKHLLNVYEKLFLNTELKGNKDKLTVELPVEEQEKRSIIKIWSSIKGISATRATILAQYYSIYDVLTNQVDTEIKINNRRLDKSTVERLKNVDIETEINILAAVNGFSRKSAMYILRNTSLLNLIDNPDYNLNITEKSKLTKKKHEKLLVLKKKLIL